MAGNRRARREKEKIRCRKQWEDKGKDKIKTSSQLGWDRSYLRAVAETFTGATRTREGSQDTGMEPGGIFSGSSPESGIDLSTHKSPPSPSPPLPFPRAARSVLRVRPTEDRSKHSNPVWGREENKGAYWLITRRSVVSQTI